MSATARSAPPVLFPDRETVVLYAKETFSDTEK